MENDKRKIYEHYKVFFDNLKGKKKYSRLGMTFATSNNYYFYDTGTGKVLNMSKPVYEVIQTLLKTDNFEAVFDLPVDILTLQKSLEEIKTAVENEFILQARPVEELTGGQIENLEDAISNELAQVTLEVTESCNLRCKYCIYSNNFESFRDFGTKMMSFTIAKRAIDDLINRSKHEKRVNIGFYGGEPLINLPLIKQCISYAEENIKDKKIFFSFTSNLTLMTEETAQYFANLKSTCSILVSLDGPKEIHDSNRVYPDGKGSFEDTIRGLKYALDAYRAVGREELIHINSVICGPDYYDTLNKIERFIKDTSWIPDNIPINISHVSRYTKPTKYTGINSKEEIENAKFIGGDPILKWNCACRNLQENKKCEFLTGDYEKKVFYMIHNRLISNKPSKKYHLNGCCIPFSRRTYVNIDGNYLPCEKVGSAPFGGNVFEGVNLNAIKKYYVDDFSKALKKYCGDCWAINLCGQCYVNCFDQNTVNFDYRHLSCQSVRMTLYNDLIEYHKILENDPESLKYLNDVTME